MNKMTKDVDMLLRDGCLYLSPLYLSPQLSSPATLLLCCGSKIVVGRGFGAVEDGAYRVYRMFDPASKKLFNINNQAVRDAVGAGLPIVQISSPEHMKYALDSMSAHVKAVEDELRLCVESLSMLNSCAEASL